MWSVVELPKPCVIFRENNNLFNFNKKTAKDVHGFILIFAIFT